MHKLSCGEKSDIQWGGLLLQSLNLVLNFSSFSAGIMPLERPKRQIRPAPFPTGPGLARPPVRLFLPSRKVDCVSQVENLVVPPPALPLKRFSQRCVDPLALNAVQSARADEDSRRQQFALKWVDCARHVATSSSWLKEADSLSDESLARAFLDTPPATLKKHLNGWLRWAAYCKISGLDCAEPSCAQLVGFLESLAVGSFLDRGKGRRKSAVSILSAMSFGARKLGLAGLTELLVSPLVCAWKRGVDWHKSLKKEAVPLPLSVLLRLEKAVLSGCDEAFFITGMLLMCWAGLRWSDAQRMDLASITHEGNCLRGLCWRTKSQKRGMVWGCIADGFENHLWGACFFEHIQQIKIKWAEQDFLFQSKGKPMSYSMGLAQLRRCLNIHGGVEQEHCGMFTLHSLKATLLAYANMRGLDPHLRAAQGHHKAEGVSSCIELYGRNEIETQLRCQRLLVQAVRDDWAPAIPLQRGLQMLDETKCCALREVATDEDDVTDVSSCSGSLSGSSASKCSSSSSSEVDSDDSLPVADIYAGPWVLNCASGVVHRGLVQEEGFGLACRPGASLHKGYELHSEDPCKLGFTACRHTGCFASAGVESWGSKLPCISVIWPHVAYWSGLPKILALVCRFRLSLVGGTVCSDHVWLESSLIERFNLLVFS